ncbi:MAG: hypothetical protein RLO80_12370 [Hyphomonas sp.]
MLFRGLVFAAGTALLASCGTVPNAGALLFDIPGSCGTSPGTSTNMICAGTDLVQTIANKPAPRMNVDYAETDAFDLQLSSSLAAELNKVTVTVPDTIKLPLEEIAAQVMPAADSPRLVFWLAQVRNSGGQIKACEVALESSLPDWLIRMGADYLKQRLTYGPADKYDATVYFDSQTEGAPIRTIVFTPRDGTTLGCG